MMWASMLAWVTGLLWGGLTTPLTMRLAARYRAVDKPGGRKKHAEVTPRGGGLALWSGFMLWILLSGSWNGVAPFVASGATLVFFIGYADDMRSLEARLRLAIHLVAAVLVVAPFDVSLLHKGLFVLWIAGCTNAFNLVDGVNGLCLSLAMSSFLLGGILTGGSLWALLFGLCGGVLVWNFPRAHTFLGDGGSTLLGFLWSSLWAVSLRETFFGMDLVPLPFLLLLFGGVPVLDTAFAVARRVFGGKSPFDPDRGHLHHRLLDRGFGVPGTVLVLVALHFALLVGGVVLLQHMGCFPNGFDGVFSSGGAV